MSEKIKNIKDYFKNHIKKSLLSVTWEKEGQVILFDKQKITLTLQEKQILKLLIALGTPKFYRTKLWLTCSGAKKDIEENPNYYQKLTELSKDLKSLYSKQIEKDLTRTFGKKNIDNEKLNKLRRVLICYSIRNSSIGYCQGFNFIVSRLLDILENEEDAFWVFSNIIEEILPLNFYSEFCGVTTEQTIILNFLEKYFPSLKNILNSEFFKSLIDNFINQCLISLFIENLNEETGNLVLDCFFLEGNIIIIKVFIAIFGELKGELLKINLEDFQSMKILLDETVKKIQRDSIYLLHCLNIRQFEFTNEYLEEIRYNLSNNLTESIENDNLDRIKIKIQNDFSFSLNEQFTNFKECNKDFPYCYNDSYFENVTQVLKFLVLSPRKNPEIKENFFFNHVKNSKQNLNEYQNKFVDNKLDLRLERRPHYCSEIIEEIKKEREKLNKNKNDEDNNLNDEENDKGFINKIKSAKFIKKATEFLGSFKPSPFFIPGNEEENDI